MRRKSFADVNCSVAQCLEVVGDWWSLLIIRDALFGVNRFDHFQSRLGISRNILTERLAHLVEAGVLERAPDPGHRGRTLYQLTDKGRDLWTVVTVMRQWGDRWAAPDGPPVEMRHRKCGHRVTLEPTCSSCGDTLHPTDLEPVPGPGASDPEFIPRSDRQQPAAEASRAGGTGGLRPVRGRRARR